MRKLVFAGNRPLVLQAAAAFSELRPVGVFAIRDSPVETALAGLPCEAVRFARRDKPAVIEALRRLDFDILLSAGTPFILPLEALRREGRIFLNIHPSLLPDLRGLHPANGALLFGREAAGATLHYMDEGIDTGDIVHQESFPITADLDLGLLYRLLFRLEAEVTAAGLRKLIDADFAYSGRPQTGPSTYYTRRDEDMRVDFAAMTGEEVLRRVRAFGIATQGVGARVGGEEYRIFAASPVEHGRLQAEFAACPPGTLLARYDEKLLVKTADGVVRITSFRGPDSSP